MYQATSSVPCLPPDYTPDPAAFRFRPDVFYARPGLWVPSEGRRGGKIQKKDYHILCLYGIIPNNVVCKRSGEAFCRKKLGGSER